MIKNDVFMVRFLLIILGYVLIPYQALAQDLTQLRNIRVGQHPDKTRLVLELSSSTPFVIFAADNPARLIIGLEKTTTSLKNTKINQGSLQEITYQPDSKNGLYAVVNLRSTAWVAGTEIIPAANNNPARLVLDVVAINNDQFRQRINTQQTIASMNVPHLVSLKNWLSLNGQLFIAAWFNEIPVPPVKPSRGESHKPTPKIVIVLDAGHGGIDSGAIGVKGTEEKKITLALVQKLKIALENEGKYLVYLTREDDRFLSLSERVNFARAVKADLFISFHADSHSNSSLSGVSVYTLSDKASDAEAQALANKENKSDIIGGVTWSDQNREVSAILIDLLQHETNTRSVFFAVTLLKELSKKITLLRNSHRSAGFLVLRAVDVPSVLIESGYLSNWQEEALLNSHDHQDKLVKAIQQAIGQYYQWQQQLSLNN